MGVTEGLESHNMLVSLHQSMVSIAELVQAVNWWNVSNNMSEASNFLELC